MHVVSPPARVARVSSRPFARRASPPTGDATTTTTSRRRGTTTTTDGRIRVNFNRELIEICPRDADAADDDDA
jgi:hypothetical protein